MTDLHACLLAAFFILQLLDGYTTYVVLKQGAHYSEANPLLSKLFAKWGVLNVLIPAKIIAFCAMAIIASYDDFIATITLISANVVYLAVVSHNFGNIED